jgi:hypothetical protein
MVNSEVTRPSISLLRSAPALRLGTLEAERALALSPNLAAGYWQRGNTLLFAGQPEKGLADLRTSLRLDPRGSNLTLRLFHFAIGCYFSRGCEDARRGGE